MRKTQRDVAAASTFSTKLDSVGTKACAASEFPSAMAPCAAHVYWPFAALALALAPCASERGTTSMDATPTRSQLS